MENRSPSQIEVLGKGTGPLAAAYSISLCSASSTLGNSVEHVPVTRQHVGGFFVICGYNSTENASSLPELEGYWLQVIKALSITRPFSGRNDHKVGQG